jgi:hypothetical protein
VGAGEEGRNDPNYAHVNKWIIIKKSYHSFMISKWLASGIWNMKAHQWCSSLNGQKTHERSSPSLAIKEIQVKTTVRFHLTTVRLATIKNTNNKCWWGKREPSCISGENKN